MNDKAVTIYCICAELLESLNIRDDPQSKMTTPEVLSFAIISALYYGCNYKTTHLVSKSLKWFS